MKIAVTGAAGLLGGRFVRVLGRNNEIVALGHQDMEITDAPRVLNVLEAERPEVVIHCAAIPNPDACEQEPDTAFAVNALGTRNVAVACRTIGAAMVYISTDFVFDWTTSGRYREYEATRTVNTYGHAKLIGERYVTEQLADFFIVRVSWLFDETFVKTMIDKVHAGETLPLIVDKFSSPTYTQDVVEAVEALLATKQYGTYHVANHGVVSRVGQAEEILRQAELNLDCIRPIRAEEKAEWIAVRPNRTALEPYLIELSGIYTMPTYPDAVKRCLAAVRAGR